MILQQVQLEDKDEEFLCNVCLEKVSVGEGIFQDLNSDAFVCQSCKEECYD